MTEESETVERKNGQGRVIWSRTARKVLLSDGIKPYTILTGNTVDTGFDYFHKTIAGADYYFVSNQNSVSAQLTATLRANGKQPELWDAVTGEVKRATAFKKIDGQISLPIDLPPTAQCLSYSRHPVRLFWLRNPPLPN